MSSIALRLHIRRLEISMNDALSVRRSHPTEQTHGYGVDLLDGQPFAPDQRRERPPATYSITSATTPFVLQPVGHPHDVGMDQPALGATLEQQPTLGCRVWRRHELERVVRPQPEMANQVDDRHAPVTQPPLDDVLALEFVTHREVHSSSVIGRLSLLPPSRARSVDWT
jgi:hypothetical protein